MKRLFLIALVSFAGLRCLCVASESPLPVKAIVSAATTAGLLSAGDFSNKILSPDEVVKLKDELRKQDWIAEIQGLEAALIGNYPAEVGIHRESGFGLSINYSAEKIILLRCSVPLVNGDQKQQKQMIETMLATTEALVGRDSGVRKWLDAEWQRSWEISAKLFDKEPIDRKEIIRKKVFGSYLVTVWGVVPDIVFLNCVRLSDYAPEPPHRAPN